MKAAQTKELILEVVKDGYRRLVYRQTTENGNVLYLEESDLVDFSRPISDNGDFNVFFSKRNIWNSLTNFTSNEGLLNRSVWHETSNEWLELKPVFVHSCLTQLIQDSLSDVLRDLSTQKPNQLEGVRNWLRASAKSSNSNRKSQTTKTQLRYAV